MHPFFRLVFTGTYFWVGVGYAHLSQEPSNGDAVPESGDSHEAPDAGVANGAGAWIRLGNLRMQQARDRVEHDFTAAGAAYEKALAIDPKQPEALIGMAWVKNSEHDFSAGKEWAEKALAADPGLQDAYCLMSDGAVELGDYDAALGYSQKALDLRADLASYSRAAHLQWLLGQSGRARLTMQRAIDAGGPFAENVAWCRAELAVMHFHDGAILPAAQQIDLALIAAPRNPRVLAAHGRILAAQKKWPEAIDAYRKSIEVTPTHDALAALADLYLVTGDLEAAGKQIERVIDFHKPSSHHHGGEVHSHGPGNAQLALFLADHDRDLDLALVEAKAACESFPNIGAFDTLAWCQYKKGNHEEALVAIRRALKWYTADSLYYFHAGMIEAALGKTAEARRDLGRALQLNSRFHPRHAPEAAAKLTELSVRTTTPVVHEVPVEPAASR
ncbi:tetratricopeptide repeat protein [Luteolibacter marinus]|uniref:tetratricopeptide repeat protein n=1 Tax=Luteolibacter marinus TaxID=2776705 RepID=UPI0018693503|nr:tetratricopeptide repeat protein [Luteolibacter marinus]